MSEPVIVIISGPPCVGKTTLGKRLAVQLHLPFLYKDGVKERLFDRLGWGSLDWSKLLSLASYDMLFYFLESLLEVGLSSLVEANFKAEEASPKFLELKERYPYIPFQIQCYAEGQVLLERFRARALSADRHPGHLDAQNEDHLRQLLLKGKHEPMMIGGPIFEIDMTDPAAIDYAGLLTALQKKTGLHTGTA